MAKRDTREGGRRRIKGGKGGKEREEGAKLPAQCIVPLTISASAIFNPPSRGGKRKGKEKGKKASVGEEGRSEKRKGPGKIRVCCSFMPSISYPPSLVWSEDRKGRRGVEKKKKDLNHREGGERGKKKGGHEIAKSGQSPTLE